MSLIFSSFNRYGRKTMFIFLPTMTMLSFVATAFATNFWLYTISSAITAFSMIGMTQTSYIIGNQIMISNKQIKTFLNSGIELIGPKYRVLCANFTNVMFTFGSLILCLIAFYIRDWRRLQLIISIPFCLTIFYYWYKNLNLFWIIIKFCHKTEFVIIRHHLTHDF